MPKATRVILDIHNDFLHTENLGSLVPSIIHTIYPRFTPAPGEIKLYAYENGHPGVLSRWPLPLSYVLWSTGLSAPLKPRPWQNTWAFFSLQRVLGLSAHTEPHVPFRHTSTIPAYVISELVKGATLVAPDEHGGWAACMWDAIIKAVVAAVLSLPRQDGNRKTANKVTFHICDDDVIVIGS